MPDIFTKRKRSDVMACIRSSGNQATELRLIQIFRAHGISGWKRGCSLSLAPRSSKDQGTSPKAKGARPKNPKPKSQTQRRAARVRPDFVFPKLKTAVFVDGCWSGLVHHPVLSPLCDSELARLPSPRHLAEDPRGLLEGQDRGQPSPRPSRQPRPAETRMGGDSDLGARTKKAR